MKNFQKRTIVKKNQSLKKVKKEGTCQSAPEISKKTIIFKGYYILVKFAMPFFMCYTHFEKGL